MLCLRSFIYMEVVFRDLACGCLENGFLKHWFTVTGALFDCRMISCMVLCGWDLFLVMTIFCFPDFIWNLFICQLFLQEDSFSSLSVSLFFHICGKRSVLRIFLWGIEKSKTNTKSSHSIVQEQELASAEQSPNLTFEESTGAEAFSLCPPCFFFFV